MHIWLFSEGQRKANFEECNSRKKENIEKITQFKKHIREQQGEPIKARNLLYYL